MAFLSGRNPNKTLDRCLYNNDQLPLAIETTEIVLHASTFSASKPRLKRLLLSKRNTLVQSTPSSATWGPTLSVNNLAVYRWGRAND